MLYTDQQSVCNVLLKIRKLVDYNGIIRKEKKVSLYNKYSAPKYNVYTFGA